MPTYVYAILNKKGHPTGKYFEVVQSMKDETLTKHPDSGRPVKRVPQAPNIAGKWSPVKARSTLSNKNLERMGFTKYERKGSGYMERVAGKEGPSTLHAD